MLIFGIAISNSAQFGCFPPVNQCAPRVWPWPYPVQQFVPACPPVVVNPVWVPQNPVVVTSFSYQWVRRPALDGNGNVIYDDRGRIVYERVRITVYH